ncbi:MAG: 2-deoxy-5-keto-D-gluconate 6-phosphate aldolase domain-containing protein [Solirubrobacteraceae bacterium]
MTATAQRRLYMLSFDQRGSFKQALMGIAGEPTDDERRRIRELKALVYRGFERALADGAPREACGLLVDEEFGADVARSAKASGFTLAMPVERSGQDEFEFEYGEQFGAHIDAFDPAFVKVLVRYNPDGEEPLNRRQSSRLAELSAWLSERGRRLLFELLVPATTAQLAQVAGEQDRYDRELRPALLVRTIAELQDAGVEPDIWKIEGLDVREDCEHAVAQARAGGRERVSCVVLGRGASIDRVADWLRQAAPVPGYVGFAIGRTIWLDALGEHLVGRLNDDAVIERIARNYRHMIDTYTAAATTPGSPRAPAAQSAR